MISNSNIQQASLSDLRSSRHRSREPRKQILCGVVYYICGGGDCKYRSKDSGSIKKHWSHGCSGRSKYVCESCKAGYDRKCHFTRHMASICPNRQSQPHQFLPDTSMVVISPDRASNQSMDYLMGIESSAARRPVIKSVTSGHEQEDQGPSTREDRSPRKRPKYQDSEGSASSVSTIRPVPAPSTWFPAQQSLNITERGAVKFSTWKSRCPPWIFAYYLESGVLGLFVLRCPVSRCAVQSFKHCKGHPFHSGLAKHIREHAKRRSLPQPVDEADMIRRYAFQGEFYSYKLANVCDVTNTVYNEQSSPMAKFLPLKRLRHITEQSRVCLTG